MLTLHLEAGKFIQMAEIPFWTKMVQYQFQQYRFSALNGVSIPPICIAVRLPFVLQYASHLYRSTFGKILVVVVTGMFPIVGGFYTPSLGSAEGGQPDLFRFPRSLPICSYLRSLFREYPDLFRLF